MSWRFPPRDRRTRWIWPELAGMGARPARAANASGERKRRTSPVSAINRAAGQDPDPGQAQQRVSADQHRQPAGQPSDPTIEPTQLGDQVPGEFCL